MNTQLKTFLLFTKSQRNGILTLFSIIIAGQTGLYVVNNASPPRNQIHELLNWQSEIDSLKALKSAPEKIYPFNPNFITDYKGYKLGMSVAQIDRLKAFRKTNQYVNSASEFQAVTKISDSLLRTISPYFKFPDWVSKKKTARPDYIASYQKKDVAPPSDINSASPEALIKVYGIGPALSERILKQRELLGGFVSMEQMNDVWGLSPEVVENLKKAFVVAVQPGVKKININKASMKELSQFPYFRYPLSKAIVTYRSMNGDIHSSEDLIKIPGFPIDKVERIAVYLDF